MEFIRKFDHLFFVCSLLSALCFPIIRTQTEKWSKMTMCNTKISVGIVNIFFFYFFFSRECNIQCTLRPVLLLLLCWSGLCVFWSDSSVVPFIHLPILTSALCNLTNLACPFSICLLTQAFLCTPVSIASGCIWL